MTSIALLIMSFCFTILPLSAQEKHDGEKEVRQGRHLREGGESVPALECRWNDPKSALQIHFLRLPADQENARAKALIADATYVEKTAWWDKKPTKIVILPAGPFRLPEQRREKALKNEVYGTASDLTAFLAVHLETGLLTELGKAQKNAADSRQTTPLDYLPRNAISKGLNIIVDGAVEEMLAGLFFATLKIEGVKDAWNAIPRPFYPENQEQVGREVFDHAFSLKGDISRKESTKLASRLTSDPASANALINALFLAVAERIDSSYPDPAKPNRIKIALGDLLSGTGNLSDLRAELERVRSLDFIKNLGQLLCDLQNKNLPIHVVMSRTMGAESKTLIEGLKQLRDVDGNLVPFRILD